MSNFMVMSDGHEIYLDRPALFSVPVSTYAHHLATINRFTGAARRPYSVAEHSLLVAEILEREMHVNAFGVLAGLMHDAHEAYTNDLSTPAKRQVGMAWAEFESPFAKAVAVAFSLVTPTFIFRAQIRRADLMALATERAQLLPATDPAGEPLADWPVLHGIEPVDWVDLMDAGRLSFTWQDWRDCFVDRYGELDYARHHHSGHQPEPATL